MRTLALVALAIAPLAGCSLLNSKSGQASVQTDVATGLACYGQLDTLAATVKTQIPACFQLVGQVQSQVKGTSK